MQNGRPTNLLKLRHVSFYVYDIERSVNFYRDILGMQVHWQPDSENVYLTNGDDLIALHQSKRNRMPHDRKFDHLGFFLEDTTAVLDWNLYLQQCGVTVSPLETHRDGSYGFYCYDPDNNSIEIITCPRLPA